MKYDKLHIALIKEVLKHKLENTKFDINLTADNTILIILLEVGVYKVSIALHFNEIKSFRDEISDYIDTKFSNIKKVFPEDEIR